MRAVERDDHVLGPGGRLALAKLASRGPAALLDIDLEPHVHARPAVGRLGEQRLHVWMRRSLKPPSDQAK